MRMYCHIFNSDRSFSLGCCFLLIFNLLVITSCHNEPIELNPLTILDIHVYKAYSCGNIANKNIVEEFDASVSIVYEDDTVGYNCMFVAEENDEFYAYDYTRSDVLYAVEKKPFRVVVETSVAGRELRAESETITLENDAVTLMLELYPLHEQEPIDFEYINLGLPSGTLWADCNVGASSPEGYGNYYAWGEISAKQTFSWTNYRHCHGSDTSITKYCSIADYGSNGFTDSLTTLVSNDDAAVTNLGTGWRMPTNEEFNELMEVCSYVWASLNGVNGYLFTAQNGNSIFLPAAGYIGEGDIGVSGSFGRYWSSSLNVDYPVYAEGVSFNSGNITVNGNYRYYGLSVRAVKIH